MRPALFAIVLLSSGCYTYQHVDTAAAPATAVARVELTDQGSVALTQSLGESVTYVEGPVTQNAGSLLEISVTSLRRRGSNLMFGWPGDRISIPSSNIRDVSLRTMNRGRTTAAVIGGTVAAIATLVVVAKSTSIFGGGDGKVIRPNIR